MRQSLTAFAVFAAFAVFTSDLFAGKKEEEVCAKCAVTAPEGGRAYAICVAAGLAGSEFDTCFRKPSDCFGPNNTIRTSIRAVVRSLFGGDDGPYINELKYVVPYRQGCIAVWRSGVYWSPDGKNLGGAGDTKNAWKVKNDHSDQIRGLVVFKDCVYTAFSGGGIYKSPDGLNLGGGGETKKVYQGAEARAMVVFKDYLYTAFSTGGIYRTSDGLNPGGEDRVYQGSKVRSMKVEGDKLRTCFENNSDYCYCDPTGDHPGGGGGTTRCK